MPGLTSSSAIIGSNRTKSTVQQPDARRAIPVAVVLQPKYLHCPHHGLSLTMSRKIGKWSVTISTSWPWSMIQRIIQQMGL